MNYQPERKPLWHALYCAREFNWAVFPCNNNKSPCSPKGHKDASINSAEIIDMWHKYRGPLVGIRTGETSNLAVLDIDKQHDGAQWWQDNRQRLPRTRTHRTRSGGLHLYYIHHLGLRCSVGRIAPGIDVRAEGGFIIYWPARGFPVLSNTKEADWPKWLIPQKAITERIWNRPIQPSSDAHCEAKLNGLIRSVARAPNGKRNCILYWAAGKAARHIKVNGLNESYWQEALIEAAKRAGLTRTESSSTIRSAFARKVA